MQMVRIALASSVVAIAYFCSPMPCQATLLGDVWGITTDPLKLGRGSENILDSVIRIQQVIQDLDSLEIRTNSDIAKRIQDLKLIIDEVIASVNNGLAVEQQLVQEVAAIEADIFQKAEILIEDAQCAVAVAANEVDTELKQAAFTIHQVNPTIRIFGIPVVKMTTDNVKVQDPWQTYQSIAAYHISEVEQLAPDSPANEFVHHYAEIVRLGRRTQCLYRGQPTALWLEQVYIAPYNALQKQWVTIVHPM
ncbi:hypothetical protein BLA39750_01945 [Burkholderia lata]|uniref:Lipoprotein n=1 Tax=Burkholderia lata (strain ATCC 17760 / DSM 23089 / LMG 22485 / NCIMB 9086 / R18194 / 383) TaxID=482957 RepID=A0A6P2WD71_BURL3|nr:hypothetical protein [Burkholderia lata]VWC91818.1 hypothetical protein BLA39750_01945 [Burkholderia lata]